MAFHFMEPFRIRNKIDIVGPIVSRFIKAGAISGVKQAYQFIYIGAVALHLKSNVE